MIITLTPEIETALAQCARKEGTTPEKFVLETLRKRLISYVTASVPPPENMTLHDLLKDYIGVMSSSEYVPGGARMSENTGKKFAAGMMRKREQGRL